MANLVAVSTLLQCARDISGFHGQSYYDNDKMIRALNRRAKVYWKELTATEDGHGIFATTVTANPSQANFLELPEECLELLRFDRPTSGTASGYQTATRVETPTFPQPDTYQGSAPGLYLIRDLSFLAVVPGFTVAEVCRLWIVTTSPELASAEDEIECVAGYEYVLAWGAVADLTTDLQKRSLYEQQHDQALAKVKRDRGRHDRGPDRVRNYNRANQPSRGQ